jgi:ubiquinone/menaquinone biosynthesis C-methylase UbiE
MSDIIDNNINNKTIENTYENKENYTTRDPLPCSWRYHPNYQILKHSSSILHNAVCADMGCNHGSCTLLIHDFNPFHVDGYDINEQALSVARKTSYDMNLHFKTNFINTNLVSIPVEDKQYDVITTFHTLEHIYPCDAENVLREFFRVLKPSGHVLISIPYKHNYPDPCHVAFYDEQSLKELFEQIGFTSVYCIEDNRWIEKGLLTGLFQKPMD